MPVPQGSGHGLLGVGKEHAIDPIASPWANSINLYVTSHTIRLWGLLFSLHSEKLPENLESFIITLCVYIYKSETDNSFLLTVAPRLQIYFSYSLPFPNTFSFRN